MIHVNGGVLNPAFIELVHLTKANKDREGGYYVQNVTPNGFTNTTCSTDVAVTVCFSSGKELVIGGIDANTIIQWYGIEIPYGMFEGAAPTEGS